MHRPMNEVADTKVAVFAGKLLAFKRPFDGLIVEAAARIVEIERGRDVLRLRTGFGRRRMAGAS